MPNLSNAVAISRRVLCTAYGACVSQVKGAVAASEMRVLNRADPFRVHPQSGADVIYCALDLMGELTGLKSACMQRRTVLSAMVVAHLPPPAVARGRESSETACKAGSLRRVPACLPNLECLCRSSGSIRAFVSRRRQHCSVCRGSYRNRALP